MTTSRSPQGPSDDEVAAVVAVLELLSPRSAEESVALDVTPAWRFSGRTPGLARRPR